MSDNTISAAAFNTWLQSTRLGESFGDSESIRDEIAELMSNINTRSREQIRVNLYFLHLLYAAFNELAKVKADTKKIGSQP